MSNEFKDLYADFTDKQKENYELCMKYPILIPKLGLDGEDIDNYEYDYTEMDNIPVGWASAFGEQWASEVQDAVNKLPEEDREKIYILQLKEKFGSFRQYFSYTTDELDEVIRKYERLSERTCIRCGAPATKISTSWISPYCYACAAKVRGRIVDIDEWFKERVAYEKNSN